MDGPVVTVTTAAALFTGTNIDDIIMLTVLFLSSRTSGRPQAWQIWIGQFVGVALLVAVAAAMALGLAVVPDDYVGLLGLVPLGLGGVGFVRTARARRAGDHGSHVVAAGLGAVIVVTVANGADNVSVYAPLFRAIGLASSLVTIVVFGLLVAVWCLAAAWLGSRPRIVAHIEEYGDWLVPAVFVVIGLAIILESGVIDQFLRHG